jgi:biopolymer transport protein ExbD
MTGGRGGGRGGKYRVVAEINMVPLIDVALVLLMIFMIMTPFLVRAQIQVNLPKSKAVDRKITKDEAIDVAVQKDGTIYVEGAVVRGDDVEAALRRLLTDPQTQAVLVEADKDVRVESLVLVLDAAKRLGASRIGLGVRQETGGRGAAPAGKR